jgi:hypothetical protein
MPLKNPSYQGLFLLEMSRLKTILATLLFACWMPATSFCLAENAGLITKNGGCADCPSSQTSSPCCALASAAYKLDDNGSVVAPSLDKLVSLVRDTVYVHSPLVVSLTHNGCEPPPELRSSWLFCARAAANPRAPSSVS